MLAAGVGFDEGTSHGAEADVPEAIRICLELGNDVNAVNDLGYTAMHGAAFRGANSVVKLLAEKGAKPNVKSKEGTTPEDLALGHKFINGGFNRHEDTAALVLIRLGEGFEFLEDGGVDRTEVTGEDDAARGGPFSDADLEAG